MEERDGLSVVLLEVLQQEEVDVPAEVLEQGEEIRVPGQGVLEWAQFTKIMATDALQ